MSDLYVYTDIETDYLVAQCKCKKFGAIAHSETTAGSSRMEITSIAYLLKRMKANRMKQEGLMITISGRQQVSPRVYLEERAKEMLCASCLLALGYV